MGSIIVFPKAGPFHSSPTEWWCRARIPQGITTKDLSLLLFLTNDPSQIQTFLLEEKSLDPPVRQHP